MITNAMLGKRIKVARVQAGLTQGQLGQQLEPPRSITAVSFMEQGESRVFAIDLIRIAQVTNMPLLSYFLEGCNA